MKRKGFTLIELLVVIAIIALLMAILMPALVKVRQLAQRVMCGTNLKGIGTAIMVYANDGNGRFPAYSNTTFALTTNPLTEPTTTSSITANLYLLIRGDYTTPGQFICGGDSGATELQLISAHWATIPAELSEAYDFGAAPDTHCSYTYQCPYGKWGLDSGSDPRVAVAADRSPYPPMTIGTAAGQFDWVGPVDSDSVGCQKNGNTTVHQREGQNVLFTDGHVEFEKRSFCAINDDNIYTIWTAAGVATGAGRSQGTAPTTASLPLDIEDSLLLSNNP